jgi:hypothetical protein
LYLQNNKQWGWPHGFTTTRTLDERGQQQVVALCVQLTVS